MNCLENIENRESSALQGRYRHFSDSVMKGDGDGEEEEMRRLIWVAA